MAVVVETVDVEVMVTVVAVVVIVDVAALVVGVVSVVATVVVTGSHRRLTTPVPLATVLGKLEQFM